MGSTVEVGVDQMPNTCGEYNTIQNGVCYQGSDVNLAINTPDIPIGIFDSIVRGQGRTTFKPGTGHFYSMICQNYWLTNFAILHPAKIVVKHIIEIEKPGTKVVPSENFEFWTYPCE